MFGDVHVKASDEHAFESLGLFIRLPRVGRHDESLHPEELTKQRKELGFKLGPILGQQVVWFSI